MPISDAVGCLLEVLQTRKTKEVRRHPLSFQTTIRKTNTWIYHNTQSPRERRLDLHRLKVRVSTDNSIHFSTLQPLYSHWDYTMPYCRTKHHTHLVFVSSSFSTHSGFNRLVIRVPWSLLWQEQRTSGPPSWKLDAENFTDGLGIPP